MTDTAQIPQEGQCEATVQQLIVKAQADRPNFYPPVFFGVVLALLFALGVYSAGTSLWLVASGLWHNYEFSDFVPKVLMSGISTVVSFFFFFRARDFNRARDWATCFEQYRTENPLFKEASADTADKMLRYFYSNWSNNGVFGGCTLFVFSCFLVYSIILGFAGFSSDVGSLTSGAYFFEKTLYGYLLLLCVCTMVIPLLFELENFVFFQILIEKEPVTLKTLRPLIVRECLTLAGVALVFLLVQGLCLNLISQHQTDVSRGAQVIASSSPEKVMRRLSEEAAAKECPKCTDISIKQYKLGSAINWRSVSYQELIVTVNARQNQRTVRSYVRFLIPDQEADKVWRQLP